jgi:hypothetical protein
VFHRTVEHGVVVEVEVDHMPVAVHGDGGDVVTEVVTAQEPAAFPIRLFGPILGMLVLVQRVGADPAPLVAISIVVTQGHHQQQIEPMPFLLPRRHGQLDGRDQLG